MKKRISSQELITKIARKLLEDNIIFRVLSNNCHTSKGCHTSSSRSGHC